MRRLPDLDTSPAAAEPSIWDRAGEGLSSFADSASAAMSQAGSAVSSWFSPSPAAPQAGASAAAAPGLLERVSQGLGGLFGGDEAQPAAPAAKRQRPMMPLPRSASEE